MKSHEFITLTESSMEIAKLKRYAVNHYPDAADETEALMILFARSLKHAEEDDRRQDNELKSLHKNVDDLDNKIIHIKQTKIIKEPVDDMKIIPTAKPTQKPKNKSKVSANSNVKSMGPINQSDLKSTPKL